MPKKKQQDPVLAETPTVTIGGKDYKLKRIPAFMAFDLAEIVEQGFGALAMAHRRGSDEKEMAQNIVYILRRNKEKLTDLFAHVLGVKSEDFNNGEVFGLATYLKLCNALGEHPDIADFLIEVRGLMNLMPADEPETQETSSREDSAS